jgi:hypothetical protein
MRTWIFVLMYIFFKDRKFYVSELSEFTIGCLCVANEVYYVEHKLQNTVRGWEKRLKISLRE